MTDFTSALEAALDALQTNIDNLNSKVGAGVSTPTSGKVLKGDATAGNSSWQDETGGSFTKATAQEIDTGTNDTKGITPLGIASSHLFTKAIHQIYMIGDSLTWNGTVQSKLKTLLGNYWAVTNFGIPANTTTLMLARFNVDIVSKRDAEYAIIWGGIVDVINDVSAATIESNLQDMYTAAHNAGMKVIAVKIAPNNGITAPRQAVLDAVNAWISSTATNVDYIVDAYTVLEDPNNLDNLLAAYDSGDHLHLSTAGYEAVGTAIYNAVTTWVMADKGNVADFIRGDGWRTISEEVTYVSVDDPTGVVDIAGDQRARFTEGMRLKFQSLGNNIKAIITNVNQTLQTGKTRISFLHEIDPSDNQALYLMANDKIIMPFYSTEKAPVGFDPDKRKWSIRIVDTTDRSQSSPVNGTVYNLGSQSINVPIGAWSLSARVQLGAIPPSSGVIEAFVGLSTANNSFSDNSTKGRVMLNAGNQIGESVDLHRDLTLTAKTTYYLNSCMTYGSGAGATLANWNGTQNLVLLAVCNYL